MNRSYNDPKKLPEQPAPSTASPPSPEHGEFYRPRMLTPAEIEQLRQETKRDNAESRARYATMKRPDLDNLPPEDEAK